MTKNNFLLVDLNDNKTKKLAETITSETSRKILNYLTEKENSEANIAQALEMPISTVHYHLQKLQEAKLVVVEEFHYSQKGREVNHYKLANKYIIIAPKKVSGLKQKLKGILPVGIIALGISAVIKVVTELTAKTSKVMYTGAKPLAMEEAAMDALPAAREIAFDAAPVVSSSPDIALWFLIGSVATILVYVLVALIREYVNKKKE